jgi:hypothetical protein
MWTTRRAKQAIVSPRPVRVAYVVPNPPSHELLDALFDEAMSRWGGRRTPIVQSDGADLGVDDWKLLGLWDADIIYSYMNLDSALHRRLAYRLAPSKIIIHPREDGDRLLPSLAEDSSLLSCVSVVPLLGKWRSFRGQAMPEVLDKERHVGVPRDLADSFGFASSSLNDFALLPYARRATLRPPNNDRYAQRFRSPDEIIYIESVAEVETKVAEQAGLLCLAQMSDMFAPYLAALHDRRFSWEDHLSIIVGDEVADRLLFWNGIHRYQSLMEPGHTQLLRLSPNRFAEGLPAWVSRLTSGLRNRRHFNGNAAPRTIVKSCSVDEEALNRIATAIRAPGMLMSSAEELSQESVFAPLRDYQLPNERSGRAAIFISGWHSPAPKADGRVRFERDQFELPLTVPFHLRDIAIGPTTGGTWAVDLRIDRSEDHSPYDNQRHRWMFPRRLRLEQAVRLENYGPDRMALTPLPRPTGEGDLCLRDGLQWKRPIITLASDLGSFTYAVSAHPPETPRQDRPREGLGLARRFMPVEVSDKGRDLLGVFQLFQSLPEALIFLTNPFWLSVIKRLCPTEPDANQERVDELGRELRQTLDRHGEAIDFGRLARRVRFDLPAFDAGLVASGAASSHHGVCGLRLGDAATLIVGGGVAGGAPDDVVDLRHREILQQGLDGEAGFVARWRLQVMEFALVLEGFQALVQGQFLPERHGLVGDSLGAWQPEPLVRHGVDGAKRLRDQVDGQHWEQAIAYLEDVVGCHPREFVVEVEGLGRRLGRDGYEPTCRKVGQEALQQE